MEGLFCIKVYPFRHRKNELIYVHKPTQQFHYNFAFLLNAAAVGLETLQKDESLLLKEQELQIYNTYLSSSHSLTAQ